MCRSTLAWTAGSSSDSASSRSSTGALPMARSTGPASASRSARASRRCWPREAKLRMSRPSRSTARSSRCGPTRVCPRRASSPRRCPQGLHEGRLVDAVRQRAAIAEPELARARHLRIEPPHLIVELGQREPATAQELEPHARQLLVPGRRAPRRARAAPGRLEQMVPPLHHAPVAPVRRQVRGKELGGEAVQEARAAPAGPPLTMARSCQPNGMTRAQGHPSPVTTQAPSSRVATIRLIVRVASARRSSPETAACGESQRTSSAGRLPRNERPTRRRPRPSRRLVLPWPLGPVMTFRCRGRANRRASDSYENQTALSIRYAPGIRSSLTPKFAWAL